MKTLRESIERGKLGFATIVYMRKKIIIPIVIVALVLAGVSIYMFTRPEKVTPTPTPNQEQPTVSETTPPVQPSFNKQQYSLTDPTSIWVIINKHYPLPTTYEPTVMVPNVRLLAASSQEQSHISKVAEPAVEEMFAAAKAENITLVFGSGYRSAALQRQVYNSYVNTDGQAKADTYSARPGYSEHQTGLALDVSGASGTCYLEICWETTPEGKWIAANAYKYGFVIRYQNGKTAITGYQYEPWHIRYVGKELAAEINKTGQTLEEFFGLEAAPTYK